MLSNKRATSLAFIGGFPLCRFYLYNKAVGNMGQAEETPCANPGDHGLLCAASGANPERRGRPDEMAELCAC